MLQTLDIIYPPLWTSHFVAVHDDIGNRYIYLSLHGAHTNFISFSNYGFLFDFNMSLKFNEKKQNILHTFLLHNDMCTKKPVNRLCRIMQAPTRVERT